ncbi:unnamed protein product [Adineta ricciae]|uniref:Uncharacterized protein n=1 Tax=Adineta ricciae TaxID=249248 RepID=A0A815U0C2_ADIRI|nr:unnamed protein product [Adineta ricciae]
MKIFFLINLFLQTSIVHPTHFFGGTITSRPYNNSQTTGPVSIIVRERLSWLRSRYFPFCSPATISAQNPMIGDYMVVGCLSGTCGSHWTGSSMNTYTWCTDYSIPLDTASGEYYNTFSIPINVAFSIGYASCCWLDQLGAGWASLGWSVVGRINTFVRPDGYLNTSPVAVTLPIIYKETNIQHVHVVQMSDFDGTDILICRWSKSSTNINSYDECDGICNGLAGGVNANLIGANCTLTFTLTTANWYYGVALQIEDFFNNAAFLANTPMTSVPLQFLFYGYGKPGGCATPPEIIGDRPNRACIGVMPNDNITERVVVQVNCPGKSIVDFISTVPRGMDKSSILNISTGVYGLILTWIPRADQYGPQGVCMAAIDNTKLQSNQWCITFLVGFKSPDVIRPTLVQGSASPVGTVFQNQTTFSIQTSKFVNRPTRNGTFIYFRNASGGGSLVQKYDCGWEPEVTYTGYTIVIRFPVAPWTPGHFFYVTMDSGVASGTEFCGPESAPMYDPTFWVFNIWNPAVSSTTTTTTTPFTTVTVTTKPTSTTSINTLLTTTGIVITTTTPMTTNATTASTSPPTTAAPTTGGPTTTGVTTESTVAVIYPKDLEDICKASIATMTAVTMKFWSATWITTPSIYFLNVDDFNFADPYSPMVADFDNDGRLDFLVSHRGNNTINVYIGSGKDDFSVQTIFRNDTDPTFSSTIAVGDFNRDSTLDLAICNGFHETINILLYKCQ